MSDEDDLEIQRIERDRRRREAELLLLLLGLSDESERHARYALRTGNDPVKAARDVWLGNEDIHQPGAAPIIAEAMADATVAGARRAMKMADLKPPAADTEEAAATEADITVQYQSDAELAARNLWGAIEPKLRDAINKPPESTLPTPDTQPPKPRGFWHRMREMGEAFDEAGVTVSHPHNIEAEVEKAIVTAHNAGMWSAFKILDPKHHLIGFVHKSVLDSGTTKICRERDGLQLLKENQYWRHNFPPLHYGCRSILLPLWGDSMVESTRQLKHSPDEGFGYAPTIELGHYFGLHL